MISIRKIKLTRSILLAKVILGGRTLTRGDIMTEPTKPRCDKHHRFFSQKLRQHIAAYHIENELPVPKGLYQTDRIDVDFHTKFHRKFARECFAAKAGRLIPHHQPTNCARCKFNRICFCGIPFLNSQDRNMINLIHSVIDETPGTAEDDGCSWMAGLIRNFISYAIIPHL